MNEKDEIIKDLKEINLQNEKKITELLVFLLLILENWRRIREKVK